VTKADAVAELLDAAERSGVPTSILKAAARELVTMRLDLAELRRCQDPRKLAADRTAQRIAAAVDAGATVEQLQERFNIPKSTLYRHLRKIRKNPTAL
jgi:DNA-binding transcriptional ArsR family regulator